MVMNSLIKITKAYKNADFASEAFVPKADLEKWMRRNWKPDESTEAPEGLICVRKKYADPAFATVAFVTPEQLPKWQRAYWAVPAKETEKAAEKAPEGPSAPPEAPAAGQDAPTEAPESPQAPVKPRARKKGIFSRK
jgi:hypothetical protein